jgi:two-component system sensor histidine kinase KdpD
VDEVKLEQVLGNLVGNAIKFSAPGTRVRVSLKRDGELARFAVEDQGPGSRLYRMFEPFQTTSVKSTAGKSTGLGLAIVKKIVNARRGGEGGERRGPRHHLPLLAPARPPGRTAEAFGRSSSDVSCDDSSRGIPLG